MTEIGRLLAVVLLVVTQVHHVALAGAEAPWEEKMEGAIETESKEVLLEFTLALIDMKRRFLRGRKDNSTNPGNDLHVSGLSSKIDNEALEALFAKVGRVRTSHF